MRHLCAYHETYKNAPARGNWRDYWHIILWNLCRLNSDGQKYILSGVPAAGPIEGEHKGGHMSIASRASSLAHRWARRLLSLLEEPLIRVRRRRTMRQSARGKIDTSKRWRRRRSTVTILEISSYLGAIVLVVVVAWSFVVMLSGPGILRGLNERCGKYSAACGADVGFLIPLLSVALASAIFLFYRLRHVTAPVVKKAKTKPHQLVETATPDIGEIVGRDQLCRVIMEDIHHSDTRRPHLLVGGVGAGKTAVLVKLTRLLAERHAVPVPI